MAFTNDKAVERDDSLRALALEQATQANPGALAHQIAKDAAVFYGFLKGDAERDDGFTEVTTAD